MAAGLLEAACRPIFRGSAQDLQGQYAAARARPVVLSA